MTEQAGKCPGYAIEPDARFSMGGMWLIALGGVLGTIFLAFQAGTLTLPTYLRDNQALLLHHGANGGRDPPPCQRVRPE